MVDRLTIQDCRDVGFCINPGVKSACATHGIDFRQFVKEGIPLSELEHLDDINVRRAVARAKERIEKNEQR